MSDNANGSRQLMTIGILIGRLFFFMGCRTADAQTASPASRASDSNFATYASERPNVLVRITPDLAASAFTFRIRAPERYYRYNGRVQTRSTYWPLKVCIGDSTVATLVAMGKRYGVQVSPSVPDSIPPDLAVEIAFQSADIDFAQFPYRMQVRLQYEVRCLDASNKKIGISHIFGVGETVNTRLPAFSRREYGCAQSASDPQLTPMLDTSVNSALNDFFGKIFPKLSDPEWVLNTLTSDADHSSASNLTLAGVRKFDSRDYRKAALYFQRALRTDQAFQSAAVYLGACYALTAEPRLATATLQSAIALDPGSEQAKQAGKWLDRLTQ